VEGGRRLVGDTLSVDKMAECYEQLYLDAKRVSSDFPERRRKHGRALEL